VRTQYDKAALGQAIHVNTNVRFWRKADISPDVRFWPKADILSFVGTTRYKTATIRTGLP